MQVKKVSSTKSKGVIEPPFVLEWNESAIKAAFVNDIIEGRCDTDLKNFLELSSSKIENHIKEDLIKINLLRLK